MTETLPDIPSSYERFAILLIFGGLALYMALNKNTEAAIGFATTIATYFLSRTGV
jgi:hypothetical protein